MYVCIGNKEGATAVAMPEASVKLTFYQMMIILFHYLNLIETDKLLAQTLITRSSKQMFSCNLLL